MSCYFHSPNFWRDTLDGRLKTIRAINVCLEEIGIHVTISETECLNEKLILMMLPVGKQQVYWLTATSHPSVNDLRIIKYRMDLLMDEDGIKIEGKAIIARNAKYVVVIEPTNIEFDKYQLKIE